MRFRIRELRHAKGLTLEALADMAGISRSYLNELELGAKTINANRLDQVARALGVAATDLILHEARSVAVAGRVGAGALVPLVDAYEKGEGLYHVSCPPQLAGRRVVAVEVEGDSMMPMYQPGHVLFFTRNSHEGVLDADVGLPCVIEDEQGNAWVKLLKRGNEPGLWNLISLNPTSESVWGRKVKWAARVALALPADLVSRIERWE